HAARVASRREEGRPSGPPMQQCLTKALDCGFGPIRPAQPAVCACKRGRGPVCCAMTLNVHSGRGRDLLGRTPLQAVRLGLWIAALVCAGLLMGAGGGRVAAQPAPERQERPVMLLDIKGAIGFVSAEQLAKALQRAASAGAQALVVRIDTPG